MSSVPGTSFSPRGIVVGSVVVPVDGGALVARVGDVEISWTASELGSGVHYEIVVHNRSSDPVSVERVGLVLDARPTQVLEHGWQSWSVVRRCAPDDLRPERSTAAEWGRATHLADPERAGAVVTGDQFLVTDGGVVGSLGGAEHLTTIEARDDGLHALALLDGIEIAGGGERALDPLWVSAGPAGQRFSEYAALWGEAAGARTDAPASTGWCSWYHYFAGVTPADVRTNLAVAAEVGLGLVQIDDGWQDAIGDWTASPSRWGEDLGVLAAEIAGAGLRAGVWTAPFLAAATSKVATDHPDWLVTHRSGHPLRAMHNEAWGGWALALDTTNPAVLDHLTAVYAGLREQAFGYHKIDFCYAAAMAGRRHDSTRTRAQALRLGLDAVRAGIGDDAFLLGCGCPLGPAVGVVDAMRVSADVAPTWEPDAHWPGFREAAPAAVSAIQASVLRAPLHRRVFINDPDCLLLRPDALDDARRAVLADVVAGTGGFTVVSDDLSAYGPEQRAGLAAAMARAAEGDAVLDLVDPFAPVVEVVSASQSLRVDWREPPTSELAPA